MATSKETKVLVNNTIMMYIMSIAKLVIPLISLPYLVRVLSVECYGSVSFIKSIISYMQILIDFGFVLSATKDLVLLIKKKESPARAIGNTLYAQMLLSLLTIVIITVICLFFDIIKGFEIFTFLYLLNAILSIFLFEYVFKAYEKMGKISIRYVIMKLISLALTLIFVKGDCNVILMPIFDIVATIVAVIMVLFQLRKMGISIDFKIKEIKKAFVTLKTSFTYFISNFATTAFSILNTLIIGLFLTKEDVAFWSLTIQIIGVIQCLYDPIINSVFPTMIKNKNLKIIHKIMILYMPLILLGCGLILLLGDFVVTLVFGEAYIYSSVLLKYMIPLLIVSFPAMLYGWPCLGAINKQKANTISTIVSACFQVAGLVLLGLINQFNLIGVVIVRNLTEVVLCVIRVCLCYSNKKMFIGIFGEKNVNE